MRRWVQALAVLAALVAGHFTVEFGDRVAEASAAPFVRSGTVGETVSLSYAQIWLREIRTTPELVTYDSSTKAAGIYLVLDVAAKGVQETTSVGGIHLIDAEGNRYESEARHGCPRNVTTVVGGWTYTMLCFDVPSAALPGLHLSMARGDAETDSSRRDDLADFDLGIDDESALDLLDVTDPIEVTRPGFAP